MHDNNDSKNDNGGGSGDDEDSKFTALKIFEQRQNPKRDISWCSNI